MIFDWRQDVSISSNPEDDVSRSSDMEDDVSIPSNADHSDAKEDTSRTSDAGHGFSDNEIACALVTETCLSTTASPTPRKFSNSTCRHCKRWVLTFSWDIKKEDQYPRFSNRTFHRHYQHLKQRSCAFCNLLLLAVRRHKSASGLRRYEGPVDIAIEWGPPVHSNDLADIRILLGKGDVYGLTKARASCTTNNGLHGDEFPVRELMDIQTVRTWLRKSRQISSISAALPAPPTLFTQGFRLIDCHEQCTVRLHTPCDYLALSYVWGKRKSAWLFASTSNIHDISKSFGLTNSTISGQRLPHMVRESMQLTVLLGHRYLWVDSICILQDDEVEKRHLIDHMHEVYQGAFATIIVPACANADSSIPGFFRRRPETYERKICVEIGGQKFQIRSSFDPGKYIKLGRHSTRAWSKSTLPKCTFDAAKHSSPRVPTGRVSPGLAILFYLDPLLMDPTITVYPETN